MANLGKFEITNRIYEDIETIIGQSLTLGANYLIQVEGSFYMCRKDSAPNENEGFHYRDSEKTFRYKHGDVTFYFKKDYPYEVTTINIDEMDAE